MNTQLTQSRTTLHRVGLVGLLALLGACADPPGAFEDTPNVKHARGVSNLAVVYPVDPQTHVTDPLANPMDRNSYQTRVGNAVAYARYAAAQFEGAGMEDVEDVTQIAKALTRLAEESGIPFEQAAKFHQRMASEIAYEDYREDVHEGILGTTGNGNLPRLGARIMDGYEKLSACRADGYDAAECCQALAWFESMVRADSLTADSLTADGEGSDYAPWTAAVVDAEVAAVARGDKAFAQPFNHLGLKAWLSYCGGTAQDVPTTLAELRYRFGDYRKELEWVVEFHPTSMAKKAGRRIFRRQFADGSVISVADTLGDGCEVRETEVILATPGRAQQFWSFDAHGQNVHHGHFPVRKGIEAVRFTPDACLGCHYQFDTRRFDVVAPSFEALHLILKKRDGEAQWAEHEYCAEPRDLVVHHEGKVQE